MQHGPGQQPFEQADGAAGAVLGCLALANMV
jgi:hypothetical protein